MTSLTRHLPLGHLRALSVALLATVFSAGLAFADEGTGPASAAGDGLANAASHAGKTVPVRAGWDGGVKPGGGDAATEDAETEDEGGENCATDPTALTDEELAEMRHGSIVCWAAHQETPEGYDNHGAWVSEWARAKAGGPDVEALRGNARARGQSNRP